MQRQPFKPPHTKSATKQKSEDIRTATTANAKENSGKFLHPPGWRLARHQMVADCHIPSNSSECFAKYLMTRWWLEESLNPLNNLTRTIFSTLPPFRPSKALPAAIARGDRGYFLSRKFSKKKKANVFQAFFKVKVKVNFI